MTLAAEHANAALLANCRLVIEAAEIALLHIWLIDIGVVRALQACQDVSRLNTLVTDLLFRPATQSQGMPIDLQRIVPDLLRNRGAYLDLELTARKVGNEAK